MRNPQSRRIRNGSDGFTLLELLTVVAIIGIVTAIGLVGFKGGGPGAIVRQATDYASGMASAARTEAIMRKQLVRLVFDTSSNAASYRRMTLITSTNGGTTWSQIGAWYRMPNNVCIAPTYSRFQGTMTISSQISGKMDPSPRSNGYSYCEFSPDGLATGTRAWIVLTAGSVSGSQVTLQGQDLLYGFYIHRLGRTSFFRDVPTIKSLNGMGS